MLFKNLYIDYNNEAKLHAWATRNNYVPLWLCINRQNAQITVFIRCIVNSLDLLAGTSFWGEGDIFPLILQERKRL